MRALLSPELRHHFGCEEFQVGGVYGFGEEQEEVADAVVYVGLELGGALLRRSHYGAA